MNSRARRTVSVNRSVRKTPSKTLSFLNRIDGSTRNVLSFEELTIGRGEDDNVTVNSKTLDSVPGKAKSLSTTTSAIDKAKEAPSPPPPFRPPIQRKSSINSKKNPRSVLGREPSLTRWDVAPASSKGKSKRPSFFNSLTESTNLLLSFEEVNIADDQQQQEEFPKPPLRRNITLDSVEFRGPSAKPPPRQQGRTMQSRREFVSTQTTERGVCRTKSTPQELPSRRNSGGYRRPSIEISPGFTFAVHSQRQGSFVSRLEDSDRSIDQDFVGPSQEFNHPALRRNSSESAALNCHAPCPGRRLSCGSRGSCEGSHPPQRRMSRTKSTPEDLPSRRNSGDWYRPCIDIAPGFSVPLRGAEETLSAFKQDRVVHTECSNCETFLYCISSANMVLCPVCREMSPVLTDDPTAFSAGDSLGMGLTVDLVMQENN